MQRLLSIIITAAFLSMPAAHATSLESIENCPALLAELKEAAIAEMEERLDANRQSTIQWQECYYYNLIDSATEYSETNVQVAGVDEADFVKNDGAYIYIFLNIWAAYLISRQKVRTITGIAVITGGRTQTPMSSDPSLWMTMFFPSLRTPLR